MNGKKFQQKSTNIFFYSSCNTKKKKKKKTIDSVVHMNIRMIRNIDILIYRKIKHQWRHSHSETFECELSSKGLL